MVNFRTGWGYSANGIGAGACSWDALKTVFGLLFTDNFHNGIRGTNFAAMFNGSRQSVNGRSHACVAPAIIRAVVNRIPPVAPITVGLGNLD